MKVILIFSTGTSKEFKSERFNTKKAAQMYDRFLKSVLGEEQVSSMIIYDQDTPPDGVR